MAGNHQIDTSYHTASKKIRPTIGYFSYGIQDHISGDIWAGLVDAARRHNVNLICFIGETLRNPNAFLAQANVIYDLVDPCQIDGLIIWTSNISVHISQQECTDFVKSFHPLPVVNLGKVQPDSPAVLVEGYQGIREMMAHLIETHGYRRLAFIRGPANHPYAQERYRAYTDTLVDYDLLLDPKLVTPPDSWEQSTGYHMAQRLLDEYSLQPGVDIEAVVTASDLLALGALKAFKEREIHVPDQIGVVGFNDSVEGRAVTPPLTSVAGPFFEQGAQALDMVVAMLAGQEVPKQVLLPSRLVVRQSCGCVNAAVRQAGVKRVNKSTVAPKAATHREALLAEMVQAAQNRIDDLPPDWAEQLADTFITEINNGTSGNFLATLETILHQITTAGRHIFVWQNVLSVLRRDALTHNDDDEILYRAENLVQQARVLISEVTRRAQTYQEVRAKQYTDTLRSIGQALVTTFDMAKLRNILANEFPEPGIPSCYLSLYQDPSAPTEGAQLILAYDQQGDIELTPDESLFPSRQLVPNNLLAREDRFIMILEALYFEQNQLGFALFEMGPTDGSTYGILRGQISSALQGALLLQERKEAEAALEEAYAEVEHQVQERTAELQHEIAERERAQAEGLRLQQEVIDTQQRSILELSTPVIPVLEGIIIMPLIGSIDSLRARDITRALLAGITQHRAKVVILDMTGVPLVDSGVANYLNKTIQAARLKGAQTIMTGISEAVAETIVDLGIDWSGLETVSDLQTGLRVALAGLRKQI